MLFVAIQNHPVTLTGWYVGYVIAAVVIVLVVAMVAIILALVRGITGLADDITDVLDDVRANTTAIPAVGTLNESLVSVVTHAAQAREALADVSVQRAWDMAARVATQTATTWMLPKTVELVGELGAEVQRHADFLASQRSGS